MENFNQNYNLEFKDSLFNSFLNDLNLLFKDQNNNFCNIAFCIYRISSYFDTHYLGRELKTNEYYDKNKLFLKFGFDKTAVSRLVNCYLRFMVGTELNHIELKEWFVGFSPSKLFELLKLADLTLERTIKDKFIIPEMTVKEIRQYVKSLQSGQDKADKVLEDLNNNIDESEIPLAYDPKQYYEFEYFQDKTKNQLLNMIWELQKEYEKLKKEIKSKNGKL